MADDGGTKATSSGHDDTVPADDASSRSSVPTIPPPPDARYQLGKELGRGGMGRVVEAFDTHLKRTVALKEVLPAGGNMDRRFQREVRITARLEHAGIVPLYDSGRLADGRPFYVMRRVSGRPLDEAIARAGDLEGRLALLPNVLSAIEAIAHAHSRRVLHRDLKPQNILVGELGETVVIDWGLAKVMGDADEAPDSLEPRLPSPADSLQTQVGSVFGTPGFMAPEQARGDELGPQGDVYALGATLYQLIAGKPPFKGTSATEVITSTLRHRYEPLTKACPGAPVELSTIIDKALAFEPGNRYANAGELAEDVRRFLTGQLVAAHRYTRRQRVARFARRHRAPLVVAALASVGIAALAWFSVHRILHERDVAEAASIEARAERAKADERATQIRERADQLLLLHARTLLDTYPTQSIAVLKQIETGGLVREEAKAIARAAVARGVAWGLPTINELTIGFQMSPDGKRVFQLTRTGVLHVIDLDARREIATYRGPLGSRGTWVDGGRLILIATAGPPILFDPATNRGEALPLAEMNEPSTTVDGTRVAFIDEAHQLQILDVKTRQVTHVPGRTPKEHVLFAPDGTWIALDERIDPKRDRFVLCDPSGRVLAERPGRVTVIARSATGKLAVATDAEVLEVSLVASPPTVTPLPLDRVDRMLVHTMLYRDDRLFILNQRNLMTWTGSQIVKLRELTDGAMFLQPAAAGALVITSGDNKIYVVQDEITHVLAVPGRPQQGIVRIATAPGSSRIVVTAKDSLLVWDLAKIIPRRVPGMSNVAFANEGTLVAVAGMSLDWEWWDIAHAQKTRAPLATGPGLPTGVDISDDGRTLVVIDQPGDRSVAVVASPGGKQIVIDGVGAGRARLVDGGGIVYSTGKGRVFGKVNDEEAREVVTLDGEVAAITPLGALGYAAISSKGELVRGRFDGGNFARTHVANPSEHAFVVGEPGGGVLVATGNRLLHWDGGALDEVARLASAITWLHASPAGAVAGIGPGELFYVPATGDRTPRRIVVGNEAFVASSGERIISVNASNQLEIVELPSLVTWTLPRMFTPMAMMVASPSGRRIYQMSGRDAVLWEIPEPASDFEAWLDELTNATEIDNHVHWPWQPG